MFLMLKSVQYLHLYSNTVVLIKSLVSLVMMFCAHVLTLFCAIELKNDRIYSNRLSTVQIIFLSYY